MNIFDKKILIIGGAGFLGTALTSWCKTHSVYNVLIADKTTPLDAILPNCDIVINCVGQITNPIQVCLQNNTATISHLLKLMKSCNAKLVHISSVNVYGSAPFVDETSPLNPETPYACCKSFAEFLIKEQLSEDKYLILRLSNLYGENQSKGILNYIIHAIKNNKELAFNNNGELLRYFLHINDSANLIMQLLISDKCITGTYNLIGQEKYTIKQLITLAEQLSNRKLNVKYDTTTPYDNIAVIDDSKINKLLAINYKYNVFDFLKKNISV